MNGVEIAPFLQPREALQCMEAERMAANIKMDEGLCTAAVSLIHLTCTMFDDMSFSHTELCITGGVAPWCESTFLHCVHALIRNSHVIYANTVNFTLQSSVKQKGNAGCGRSDALLPAWIIVW